MEDRRLEKNCDIVVVGAGHAGCEAALACARLGLDTVMFTVSVDSIALMPCNPNVGGSSKGHLVRELDALGGEMGKNIDKTFIQSKMLNQSKGPAVHSLRAQADKQAYSTEMRKTLENQSNLTIKQGEVTKLLVEDGKITVDSSKCNFCGRCTKACPTDAYDNTHGYIVSFGGIFGNHINKGKTVIPFIEDHEKLLKVCDAAIGFFEKNAKAGERLKFTIDRVGEDEFNKEILEAYENE